MKKNVFLILLVILLLASNTHLLAAQVDDPSGEGASNADVQQITLADPSVQVELLGDSAYRVSLGGEMSRVLPQRPQIRLRYHTFDPLTEDAARAVPGGLTAGRGANVYIVQFVTQALETYQKEITQLGARLYVPVPDQAYIVWMSDAVRRKVEQLPYVRWIGPYQPAYKLEADLVNLLAANGPNLRQRYSILVLEKGVMQDTLAARIAALGGTVDGRSLSRRMIATLDNAQLEQVARMDEVLFIDRWTPAEDDMDAVRLVGGANWLETVAGYTGQGVGAEVLDRGFRITHQDFQANPLVVHSQDHNPDDVAHSTEVAGIMFGSGAGDPTARGMLPDAARPIVASRYRLGWTSGQPTLAERYAHTQESIDPNGPYRVVLQTSSWGSSRTLDYTTISAEMDEILFDLDLLALQSQSNARGRMLRPQAWAKNIIGVGGIHGSDTPTDRSDDYWERASIGPASDGRIKSDLSNFYENTWTVSRSGDTLYRNFSGTSGSTPATAGYFGLMFQIWADGVFNGGPGQDRDVFDSRPHASTARALMIHSAYQYSFSGTAHNLTRVHQGWGFPDVKNLYELAQDHGWSLPLLINESQVIAPLETHSYRLNVAGGAPLKATLVYADPPGFPGAAVHRINDLSLKLTSPSGAVYWGNSGLLTGNWSTLGGTSNTIDSVENVFVQDPAAGGWTVEVLADEVIQDGHVETPALDADYALVVSGGGIAPLEHNPNGGEALEIEEDEGGAQSFRHGHAGDPDYGVSKIVLYLSRDAETPGGDLVFNQQFSV